jgi:hypothetical protein
MGTSGPSDGPNPDTPLVPSWLGNSPAAPPAGDGGAPPVPRVPGDANAPAFPVPSPLPPMPPAPPPDRFRSARRNFSQFAGSGGSDTRALRRGVRDYVRSGAGSSRNATARMGASRTAARGVLGVLRDFQRDGVGATLRRLNLGDLAGRPLADVFLGLTDVVCRDGGSIDEGIARDAWLETVADLGALAAADADILTAEQMRDAFLVFIAHSIEGRLFQDIGTKGFKFAADLNAIAAFEHQLRTYIRRAVRDSFTGDLATPTTLSDQQIRTIVDRTYDDAWDILVTWGDAAG